MANKDQPLEIGFGGGRLTISIGVSALCQALRRGPAFETDGEGEPEITDEDVFARAVIEQLQVEEEDGGNAIHRMFDTAAGTAIEEGAEGVRFPGDA